MANPQCENGHVRIATEVIEQLAKINLPAYEWRVLLCVLRKTWGWRKKTDFIPLSNISQITGLPRSHACRARRSLIEKNILTEQNGRYGFNKDYDTWAVTNTGNKITNSGNAAVTNSGNGITSTGNKSLPIQAPQYKRKKLNQKKGVRFEDFWKLFKEHSPSEVGSKKNAKARWQTVIKKTKPERIIEGLMEFSLRHKRKREQGKFAPAWKYCERWLKSEEWKLEPEPETTMPFDQESAAQREKMLAGTA